MSDINNLKSTPAGTLDINWSVVENHLGFQLHENIKTLYSHVLINEDEFYNDDLKTLITTLNRTSPSSLDFECEIIIKDQALAVLCHEYSSIFNSLPNHDCSTVFAAYAVLFLLESSRSKYICDFFKERFCGEWNRNKFINKMQIGYLEQDLFDAKLYLIFDNENGCFELCVLDDYILHYDDCPHVIITNNTEEFLNLLQPLRCKRHLNHNEIIQQIQEYIAKKKK